ncbi:MAG: ribonuclease P protein component [Anaerolineae bacterium]|jgi:ribonuclease P protein component|nr:ribonuclease P protein component [Anaerolineae bacterium]MDH7474284.1 ribonuclease P protein component [Anaerolineae bacterium]
MEKTYRLRKNEQFQKVRNEGRSWSNRWLVLCALRNGLPYNRFGFTASRRLGSAVVRNRARRLMREAVRLRREALSPGWDLVLVARSPLREASFHEVDQAVEQLLRRARLLSGGQGARSLLTKVNG